MLGVHKAGHGSQDEVSSLASGHLASLSVHFTRPQGIRIGRHPGDPTLTDPLFFSTDEAIEHQRGCASSIAVARSNLTLLIEKQMKVNRCCF